MEPVWKPGDVRMGRSKAGSPCTAAHGAGSYTGYGTATRLLMSAHKRQKKKKEIAFGLKFAPSAPPAFSPSLLQKKDRFESDSEAPSATVCAIYFSKAD